MRIPQPASSEALHAILRGRLTWKDHTGAIRFASVRTRHVSNTEAFVETDTAVAIPLYKIVHLQLEREDRAVVDLPEALRGGRILSAVWQVGPCRRATGTPEGYSLRFLVNPPAVAGAACRLPAC